MFNKFGIYATRKNKNNQPMFEGDVNSALDYVLWRCFGQFEGISFLQIGASDGKINDPVYNLVRKYNWHGHAVEPLKSSFERLQDTYRGTNVTLINAAVTSVESEQTMYRLDEAKLPSDVPAWAHQIASFQREHLLKFKEHFPNLENLIIEEKVDGIPLSAMIDRYSISDLDLMQIDTEGFDYQIFKMIDFDKISPRVINLEYEHLSRDQVLEIENDLTENGYQYIVGRRDLIGFRGIKQF